MMAYTAGRIDGWMLACAFAAGYQLCCFEASGRAWHLFAAGCLISLGFFVWPSIAFLLPLLGLELWRANRRCSRPLWQSLAIAGSGAALVFLGLGLVLLLRVPSVLSDIPRQLAVAGMAGSAASGLATDIRSELRTLVALLIVRSPWNVPFAILVWRSGASRAPLAWMLLPIAIMLATLLYGNRVIYLLPYLTIAFSGVFAAATAMPERRRKPGAAAWWLLLGSVATSFVFAAVVRPVLPWLHRATRSETLLYAAAQSAAARSSSVCLDGSAIEFYLMGRSLDWRMFMLTPDTVANCETAIVRPDETAQVARLGAAGFRQEKTLLANQRNDAPVWEQHVYGYYVYGPYDIYRRR